MTDYSKRSDFEINVAVSLELFEGSSGGDVSRIATWCACKENGDYGLFDPCNNPSYAWPILKEYCIDINWDGDSDSEPLRDAMIVYLMMKESENG